MQQLNILLVLLFVLFTNFTFPQVPRIINYQGILLESDGQPVPEGEYTVTFSLYDEPGNILWSETHLQVFITEGLFQVHLGGIIPLELPFDQIYYLGIKINDDPELEPRMILTSAAYSIRSAITETLGGFTASEVPMPNTILPLDNTGMFPASVIPPDSGGGGGGIGGSGTPNYIPRFNSEYTLGNSIIYQSEGNLGIGTTSPTAKLELAGSDAKIHGLTLGRGNGSLGNNAAFGYQSLYSNTTGEFNTAIGLNTLQQNTTGHHNTAIGGGSLLLTTTGYYNTAIGYGTMQTNVGCVNNTAIGYRAMFFSNDNGSNIESNNTAVGVSALEGSSSPASNNGTGNTAVGSKALSLNSSGSVNCAFGFNSLSSNTEGQYNCAFGANSLNHNTSGSNNSAFGNGSLAFSTGNFNSAFGANSMGSNTDGYSNCAFGGDALFSNVSGFQNTAVGFSSLSSNTEGVNNTACGAYSLESSITGNLNSAFGYNSLKSNTTGLSNSAFGGSSLSSNTTGDYNSAFGTGALASCNSISNSAFGYESLHYNTTGIGNTAFGENSLKYNTTGSYNSAFGRQAGYTLTTGSNNTLIGFNASPSSDNVSNEITLGNNNISTLRCNVTSISSLSDRRDKTNIRDLSLGIDFLMSIKPRLFNWDKREWYKDRKPDGSKMKQIPAAGFIAQELYEAQIKANAEWLNLVLKSNPDRLEATAGNLLPVIVKAVQELKSENDSLRRELESLRRSIAEQVRIEVKKIIKNGTMTKTALTEISVN